MKNLIILLFFVSFAAQAQYTRVQYGDSIYGNKVKFNNIEYTVPSGDALLAEVNDLLWIPAGTVSATNPGRFPNYRVITPLPADGQTLWGSTWSDWWNISVNDNTFWGPSNPVRIGGIVFEYDGWADYTGFPRPSFNLIISNRDRDVVPFRGAEVEVGDVIYIWRLGAQGVLWDVNLR